MPSFLLALFSALTLLAGAARADFETGLAAYDRGDYATAHREWLPLAEAGDPAAQANLAVLYWRGLGVAPDPARAARWFRLAAEAGNAIAQDNLGQMYYLGEGVEKSTEEAARWIRAAAMQGDPNAQLRLGSLYAEGIGVARDPERAVMWWRKAAEQGNEEARLRLELAGKPREPEPAPPVSAPPPAGHVLVQVASVRTPEDARREWERLQHQHPELLAALELDIDRADLGDRGVFYRVRGGPLADRARADALCAALTDQKVGCLVVEP